MSNFRIPSAFGRANPSRAGDSTDWLAQGISVARTNHYGGAFIDDKLRMLELLLNTLSRQLALQPDDTRQKVVIIAVNDRIGEGKTLSADALAQVGLILSYLEPDADTRRNIEPLIEQAFIAQRDSGRIELPYNLKDYVRAELVSDEQTISPLREELFASPDGATLLALFSSKA